MSRRPKPWYRSDRRAWFVTINGVRHNLGPNKERAFSQFHDMMARPVDRRVASGSVLGIIEAFLEWTSLHRAPVTYAWYRDRLQRFAETYPNLTVRDFRPYHVQQWLDAMTSVTSGTRRNYCRTVKRMMRWAEQQGYIDRNPIAHLEQPKAGKRETVISQAQFDDLLRFTSDRHLRDLLITTWETGCRPQESLRVEARHVDATNRRWVFPESEGKGKQLRVVYLTDKAWAITTRLMLQFPDGKLFRNSRGKPWTTESVNCAFMHLQVKMGLEVVKQQCAEIDESEVREFMKGLAKERVVGGVEVTKSERDLELEARRKLRYRLARSLAPKFSLYALRHSWATHALERGLDALTVAVLMGHRDPSTLAKVYQHLTHNPEFLREQARRAVS